MAPVLFRIQRGERTIETASAVLTVGTHSNCSILLRDPLASEEHCTLAWLQGSFQVEDLGSATGTYLNGFPLEGRAALHLGDVLVVGASRLTITDVGTSAAPLLHVSVEESVFHYVASGAGGQKRDADAWVHWEVAFGRLRGLRIVGWIAAAVALALLCTPWLRTTEETVLSAGTLRASHAILFERDDAGIQAFFREQNRKPPADLERMTKLARSEGCEVCHDAFHGTPLAKCGACHTQKLGVQHPFLAEPKGPSELSFAGWREDDCVGCHAEHKGPGDPHGPNRPEEAEGTCANCHEPEQRSKAVAGFEEKIRRGVTGPAEVLAFDAVRSPEFSHKVHLGAGAQCLDCHRRAEQPGAQYPAPTYKGCMECHAEDASGRLASRKLRVNLKVHGTDNDGALCKECHETPKQAALKTVPGPTEALAFQVTRRPHGDVFPRPNDCIHCHVDGPPPIAGQTLTQPFQHGVHLVALTAPANAATPADAGAACLECHGNQGKASGFVVHEQELVPDLARTCGGCHKDDAGHPLPIDPVVKSRPESAARVAFSHAEHTGVVGGCFGCHAFEPTDEPFRARPVTRDGVKRCTDCHDATHATLAQGACAKCHRSPGGGHAPLVFTGMPETVERPEVIGFDHFSKGHAKAQKEQGCELCHPGIADADDARSIPVLGEASQVCANCHYNGARFHFQLPSH